jgi:hypothetical protein
MPSVPQHQPRKKKKKHHLHPPAWSDDEEEGSVYAKQREFREAARAHPELLEPTNHLGATRSVDWGRRKNKPQQQVKRGFGVLGVPSDAAWVW